MTTVFLILCSILLDKRVDDGRFSSVSNYRFVHAKKKTTEQNRTTKQIEIEDNNYFLFVCSATHTHTHRKRNFVG